LLACRAARGNRRAPRHSTFPSQSVNELAPPHAGGTGAVPKNPSQRSHQKTFSRGE